MTQPKLTIRFAAVLMAALMLLPTFGAQAASDIEVSPQVEGMGTSSSPIQLGNAEDLKRFAERYNAGGFKDMGEGGVLYAALSADISLEGVEVAPIGTYVYPFNGVLDGAGHVISGLSSTGGLFDVVNYGRIHDLALVGVDITAEGGTGALANFVQNGTVERVYASGTVAGANNVGGLIGYAESTTLQSLRSDVEVTHTGAEGHAGGLVGIMLRGGASASLATGRVEAGSGVTAGGVAGQMENPATATDLVALQAMVSGGANSHRVAGALSGGVPGGLRAWAGMWLNGATTAGGAANSAQGADAATADLTNDTVAFWTTAGFSAETGWRVEAGKLPVLAGLAGQSAALPDYFDPNSGYPYKTLSIADEAGFAAFAAAVNSGTSYANTVVKLEADLDLSGAAIKAALPIGKNGTLFAGVLDGGGHTLSKLEISAASSAKVGLFSELKNATVRNVKLIVTSVAGGASVGALVGSVAAGGSVRIENCAASPAVFGSAVHVSGTGSVGGLVGSAGGAAILGCEASVSPVTTGSGSVGGIAGTAGDGALIRHSMYAGSINTAGNAATGSVGGIVGVLSGASAAVEESFVIASASGSITVGSSASAGGIAGRVENATVRNSYNINLTVQSTGTGTVLGGLAGTVSGGLIEYSYAAAGVMGSGAGGLAGKVENAGRVQNSVSLAGKIALIPRIANKTGTGTLQNNYAWTEMDPASLSQDADSPNGANVPLAELMSGAGFAAVTDGAGGFADEAVWSLSAGRLPILAAAGHGQQGTAPLYLQEVLGGGAMQGSGTEADPFLIATAAHLLTMAKKVNSGEGVGTTAYYKAHYRLTADIDMDPSGLNVEGKSWESAGDGAIGFVFEGVFDGGGHTISNLNVPYASGDEAGGGLFGTLKGATVKNLTLESPVVQKMKLPGAIAGSAQSSTLENCTVRNLDLDLYTSGASEGAGFLVGSAKDTTFTNCHAEGHFSERVSMAGGIVGSITGGSITDSSFTGSIEAGGKVGGLAGYAEGAAITGGYVDASVRAMRFGGETAATQYAGGIVGDAANAAISRCAFAGSVDADQYAGGIAGRAVYGSVAQSYSCGSVTAGKYAGGIAGTLSGAAASHCYTTGVVLATETHAGGIAGIVQAGTWKSKKYGGSVTSSYALAQVQAQSGYAGGIAGQLAANASGQSGKNTLKNDVAINVSVTSSGTTIGRVAGAVGSGATVTACHATARFSGVSAEQKGAAQGTAVGLAALARPTFWQGLGFAADAGWLYATSRLPVLFTGSANPGDWDGSLPFHLTGYTTKFFLTAWQDGRPVEQVTIGDKTVDKVDMAVIDREVEFRMVAAEGQQWTEYETNWAVASHPDYTPDFEEGCFGTPTGQGEAVVCALTIPAGYKGTFTVTATDKNSGATASFTLRVIERVAKITLAPADLALDIGGTGKLEPTVLPAGADDTSVKAWKTNNEKVATVDQSGSVKGVGYGTAMITATTADGGYSASVAVRVAPGLGESDLGISKTTLSLNVGKAATLKPTYKNAKVVISALEWDIVPPDVGSETGFDADAIARVDANGKITAVGPGEARVALTATPSVGAARTVYCALTVKLPATAANIVDTQNYQGNGHAYTEDQLLNKKAVRLVLSDYADPGADPATATDLRANRDSIWLSAVLSAAASNDDVTWKVSGKANAVVEATGGKSGEPLVLKARNAGTVTVTATTALGKKSAKVTVSVVAPVGGVSIQNTSGGLYGSYLAAGTSATLKADVTGVGGGTPTNTKVIWTSSDPSIAAVNASSGKVSAKAKGSVTITAKSADVTANGSPAASASCTLHVVAPVKTAKTSQSAFSLPSGGAYEADARYHRTLSLNLNSGGAVTHKDPVSGGAYISYDWSLPTGAPLVFVDGEGREAATSTDITPTLRVKTGGSLEKNTPVTVTAKVQSKDAKAVTTTLKVTVLSAENSKGYVPVDEAKFKITNTGAADNVVTVLVGSTFKPALAFGTPAPSDKNVSWDITLSGGPGTWSDYLSIDTTTGLIRGLASTWDGGNPLSQHTLTLEAKAADNPAATAQYTVRVVQRATSMKVSSDGGNTVDVTREAGLYGGGSLTLSATVAPEKTSNKRVVWSSAQENKTIGMARNTDGTLTVTGIKAGTATIKATADDGSKKSATFKVTVVQQVDGFTLTVPAKHQVKDADTGAVLPGLAAMDRGQSATLKATFNAGLKANQPKNKTLIWTSTDETVATVTNKGVVKAVGDGEATITAVPADASGGAAAQSVRVTVTAKATKVAMQQKKFNLYAGRTVSIGAATTPEIAQLSAGQDTLLWTVANYGALDFVDENGNPLGEVVGTTTKKTYETAAGVEGIILKAAAAGIDGKLPGGKTSLTCRVTATTKSGKSASVDIVVTSVRKSAAQVQGVSLNKNSLWLQKGKAETLKATLAGEVLAYGAKATAPGNKNLVWSVTTLTGSPTDIATVSTAGKVTAKGTGAVRVTVRAVDARSTTGWENEASCVVYCVAKN